MLEITFSGAIIAGLLSFLSPCIMPMVPFYLCYLAGISMNELKDEKDIPPTTHRKLVIASIFFALGTTTIFVLLGLGASFLGQFLRIWRGKPYEFLKFRRIFRIVVQGKYQTVFHRCKSQTPLWVLLHYGFLEFFPIILLHHN